MFEALALRNFQTHRKLSIEFDSGITTIIGETDAGKSAIVRALRWVCFNDAAIGFRKHGTKSTTVRLLIDGKRLYRTRSKLNSYRLDSKQYHAVKQSVPERVSKLLN